jgi:hypothetical protein
MRNKKAKELRRQMREKGFDPKQTNYVEKHRRNKPVYGLDNLGNKVVVGGTTTATQELGGCGRKIYQQLKKQVKQ